MDDVLFVQVLQTLQTPHQHILTDVFRVGLMQILHEARHCIIHQLDEDPEPLFELVSLQHSQHDVVLRAHLHQGHLVQDY